MKIHFDSNKIRNSFSFALVSDRIDRKNSHFIDRTPLFRRMRKIREGRSQSQRARIHGRVLSFPSGSFVPAAQFEGDLSSYD